MTFVQFLSQWFVIVALETKSAKDIPNENRRTFFDEPYLVSNDIARKPLVLTKSANF